MFKKQNFRKSALFNSTRGHTIFKYNMYVRTNVHMKKFMGILQDTRTYRRTNVDSDHLALTATVRKKIIKDKKREKWGLKN